MSTALSSPARLPVLHLAAAFGASLLAALAIVPADLAARLPVLVVEPAVLQSFATKNPACNEWTDSCFVCKRGEDSKARCSTAGIACTPVEIVCKVEQAK